MSQQALEAAKLEFERWKVQYQEDNKFAIAEMTANKSLAQAAMTANRANPDGDTEFAEDGSEQPSSGFQMLAETMNNGLMQMAQMHQQSHEQIVAALTRPKTVIRDDSGRAVGVQ